MSERASEIVEKDGKLHVSVEYIRWLRAEQRKVNRFALKDIVLTEEGRVIELPEKRIERLRFIGLNNTCLIEDGIIHERYEDERNWGD